VSSAELKLKLSMSKRTCFRPQLTILHFAAHLDFMRWEKRPERIEDRDRGTPRGL
jgi:hypothetical protein